MKSADEIFNSKEYQKMLIAQWREGGMSREDAVKLMNEILEFKVEENDELSTD